MSEDLVNSNGASTHEIVVAPTSGQTKRSGVVATFYWRPFGDEGKPPIPVRVLQHYLRGGMLSNAEIQGALSEAERGSLQDQITVLIRKSGEFKAQLLLDELEGKPLTAEENESARKLEKLNGMVEQLKAQHSNTPSMWQLRARDILCPTLMDDYLEINGEKIKVEPESIATMDNLYLIDLYSGVTNFLVDVTKRKNG